MAKQLIAVDYDGTITSDPELWQVLIKMFKLRGHEVIICTMRTDNEPIEMRFNVMVYYTGRLGKMEFLRRLGIIPDVWIDDQPHFIYHDAL